MTEPVTNRPRTPVHLWIVGILALLWHLMAVWDYLATQLELESYMSQFSEEQLEYFYSFPAWVVSCWALAVWGGFLASVGLLLRKRWAVWLFGLSLVCLAITTLHNFVLTDGAAIMGTVAVIFTVVIWVVTIALLLYSRAMARKGVLT